MKPDKAKRKIKDRRSFFYMLSIPIAGPLVRIPFGLRVIKGKNNIPKTGAAIAAGNHIHFADPVFLFFAQKRQIRYMAKVELFKKRMLGWLCRSYGAFPVERGTGDNESLNKSIALLDEGRVIGIFPEGTRSKNGRVGRGKTGVIHIAYQSGAAIYPFGVFSRKRALSIGSRYTIAYGEPVTAEQLGVVNGTPREFREATRKLMDIIAELYDDCREYRGYPRINNVAEASADGEEAE